MQDSFQRGRAEAFLIKAADVGEMERVQIRHDGSGVDASWFLDTVIVENMSTAATCVLASPPPAPALALWPKAADEALCAGFAPPCISVQPAA